MRDLEKDLALCEAATPGPWKDEPAEGPWSQGITGPRGAAWVFLDGHGHFPRVNRPNDPEVSLLAGGPVGSAVCLLYEGGEIDAAFIAAAREGWPEAIRRAMAAEAEVERLKRRITQLAEDPPFPESEVTDRPPTTPDKHEVDLYKEAYRDAIKDALSILDEAGDPT